jgi:uncharacterized protein (TIGR03435 family)
MRSLLFIPLFLASAAAQTFDAASIKPTQSGPNSSSGITTKTGRLIANNVTLKRCIRGAYNVAEANILGGQKWVDEDRFDIEAKAPGPAGDAELSIMLRALLADRFHLQMHRETRQLPGYSLVLTKTGIKAKPAKPDTESNSNSSNGKIEGTSCTMAQFALKLSEALHAPVADATGLDGKFDYKLVWPPADLDTAIFAAIQEQLGLKLESRKVPVEVIVIDRADRPSEN